MDILLHLFDMVCAGLHLIEAEHPQRVPAISEDEYPAGCGFYRNRGADFNLLILWKKP
jgi:hypothetical protein